MQNYKQEDTLVTQFMRGRGPSQFKLKLTMFPVQVFAIGTWYITTFANQIIHVPLVVMPIKRIFVDFHRIDAHGQDAAYVNVELSVHGMV